MSPDKPTGKVQLDVITFMKEVQPGVFTPYPGTIFQKDDYHSLGIVGVWPAEEGYPAPFGAIVERAIVSPDCFETIDDQQSGNDVEGEVPEMAIFEGSVVDLDTATKRDVKNCRIILSSSTAE